jgi:predicted PurR-regulated permease PerM
MPVHPYVRPVAFFLMLLGISVAFFGMIIPFFMALFWASLLALLFRRPYRLIRLRLRGRDSLAAILTILIILLIVVVPGFFIVLALINESVGVYNKVESGEWDLTKIVDFIQTQTPRFEKVLKEMGMTPAKMKADLADFAVNAARTVADRLMGYTQNAITFIVQFFLMLYVLFFFIRDGQNILNSIMNALPLGNRWERKLMDRFTAVARATLKGTLIVAIVQGSMGAAIFAILGIEGAIFWGVIMTFLSILPVGGSGIVWGPAAIMLGWQGLWGKALVLVIVGALGIGLIDNILRPILVGRDTKMPDYLVLIATLGGLGWFGLTGFILGPVIAAMFITFWNAAGREYGGRDA